MLRTACGTIVVLLSALTPLPIYTDANKPNFHGLPEFGKVHKCDETTDSIYNNTDYNFRNVHKNGSIPISQYDGKVLILINVASFWGYTHYYPALNALNNQYTDVAILGVPCNQFGHQEPEDNSTEIYNTLKYVRPGHGFVPNFKLSEKLDVNGPKSHPLYAFLKSKCATGAHNSFGDPKEMFWTPFQADDIRWNFEKFIISKAGIPLYRAEPAVHPFHDSFKNALTAARAH